MDLGPCTYDKNFCFLLRYPTLGTVARVLGKQSQLGCLDELYKSVEGLSDHFFLTKSCKRMLLAPLNSAFDHCSRLKARADDRNNPRAVYVCKDTTCLAHFGGNASFCSIPDAICMCGKVMEYADDRPEQEKFDLPSGACELGVFVNGGLKFIVTDDLRVAPASTSLMMSLIEEFGVRDPANLEQIIVQFTSEEIHNLLKTSLTSKQLLTELCFDVPWAHDDVYQYVLPEDSYPEHEIDAERTQDGVNIKVIQSKNNSSLLYAEVGHDFVDLLFGILCIPLGSIMKAYGVCSSNGCIDNLYWSIDGSAKECMRPECQTLLLSQKLAPFFGCGASELLQVEEVPPHEQMIDGCFKCFKTHGFSGLASCSTGMTSCKSYQKYKPFRQRDPRLTDRSNNREAYIKQGHQTFMLTDNLNVHPLSLGSALKAVVEARIERTDLVEKEYTLNNSQVIELVKAALVTRKALSAVLLPPKNKKLDPYSPGLC